MINVSILPTNELDELITLAQEEKEKRRKYAQTEAWNKVVTALENYCNNFGIIEYISYDGEHFEIEAIRENTSEIGTISMYEA
jgi:hypothetical protein